MKKKSIRYQEKKRKPQQTETEIKKSEKIEVEIKLRERMNEKILYFSLSISCEFLSFSQFLFPESKKAENIKDE